MTGDRWRLLREVRLTADMSIAGLKRLKKRFEGACSTGRTEVGPKTFHMVLSRQGIRDAVLHTRLFKELSLLNDVGELQTVHCHCGRHLRHLL